MTPALGHIAAQLDRARAQTDALFSLLDPAALYSRPVADRHRLIFYLGHVEAFDWNLLSARAFSKPPFHPGFDKLFAFGIDPEPGRAPADQPSDWPRESQVRAYCARVRRQLDESIAAMSDAGHNQLLNVAIEHRLMHAETLAYLIHNLPAESKRGPLPQSSSVSSIATQGSGGGTIAIPAGDALLGRPSGAGFGWDNEFESHSIHVPSFRISRFKISNGEYLDFVRSAGATPPNFWTDRNGVYFLRAMFGEIPLPLDWPVYVTHREAIDYAHWRSQLDGREYTLPTEAQFHRASEGASPLNADFERWDPVAVNAPGVPRQNHGASPNGPAHKNALASDDHDSSENARATNGNSSHYATNSPNPSVAPGTSRHGVHQLIGNGWEWTSTVFAPFPGFAPFEFYPGYSADFFDGKHFVLKGGSPRTARELLRPSFRNWFRADYPYLYAGFRLVDNRS